MALTKPDLIKYLDTAIKETSRIIESDDTPWELRIEAAETLSGLMQTRHEINLPDDGSTD